MVLQAVITLSVDLSKIYRSVHQLKRLVVLGRDVTKFVVLLEKLKIDTKLSVVQKNNCQDVSAEKSDIRWRYGKLNTLNASIDALGRSNVKKLPNCFIVFFKFLSEFSSL